jgi:predicted nucleotidyltransferase
MMDVKQSCPDLTDLDYWIALDCWEAIETLELQGKTPTAAAVQRLLDPEGNDPTVTLSTIERAMVQVQWWQRPVFQANNHDQSRAR